MELKSMKELRKYHLILAEREWLRSTLLMGNQIAHSKGGLDEILAITTRIQDGDNVRPITDEDKKAIQAQNESMASNALKSPRCWL